MQKQGQRTHLVALTVRKIQIWRTGTEKVQQEQVKVEVKVVAHEIQVKGLVCFLLVTS